MKEQLECFNAELEIKKLVSKDQQLYDKITDVKLEDVSVQ